MSDESRGSERLSVLQASHAVLCERRRNLHRTIDSLERAGSAAPEAVASLEAYKNNERAISQERAVLYREIGELVQMLAPRADDRPVISGLPAEAALEDYAELLRRGFCVPSRDRGTHELSVEEQAWVEALGREAAKDEIRVTHTWFKDRGGGWRLIATIAPPRHNKSYGVPRPLSDELWRQRFELDWGRRLVRARQRVAAERPTPQQRPRRSRPLQA